MVTFLSKLLRIGLWFALWAAFIVAFGAIARVTNALFLIGWGVL
jgi:hypothetical protein